VLRDDFSERINRVIRGFAVFTSCRLKAYTRQNKMYKCWILREGNRITPITGTGWSSNNVATAYGHIPLTVQSHLWISAGRSVASCTQKSYVQHAFSLPTVSVHSAPLFSVGQCGTARLLTWILIKLYINLWTATTDMFLGLNRRKEKNLIIQDDNVSREEKTKSQMETLW